MSKFLQQISTYLYAQYRNELSEMTLVFPNRRAGLFFQKYLSEVVEAPLFSPEIITISDLVVRFAQLRSVDQVSAVIELYQVFKEITHTAESLDDFFFWGEMMLSDFNDIDKYGVDAQKLFQNIDSLKEIDEGFDFLTEEQLVFLSSFWKNLLDSRSSDDKTKFLTLWKHLFPIYQRFNEHLEQKGLASDGMIYRKAAFNVGSPLFENDGHRYAFIGFNALNECEKKIFRYLKTNNEALFFWDYDDYYLSQSHHEASMFMEANLKLFPMPVDFDPGFNNFKHVESIQVVAVPGFMGQASYVGQWITQNHKRELEQFDHTAVVLCDENLLVPVMNSITDGVETMNVTMGYPLKDAPVFSLVKSIIDLDRNVRQQSGNTVFYYRTVLNVLNHSLLKPHLGEVIAEIEQMIKRTNRIYLQISDMGHHALIDQIFNMSEHVGDCKNYLQKILLALFERSPESDTISKECIYQTHLALNRMSQTLEQTTHEQQLSKRLFYQILIKSLERLSIPFEGEPLSGLQVMGFLETRCLDFNRLVLLSMNDNQLPGSTSGHSFVPYALRKGFGLPLIEQRNAMYAYYFYRLIQRANEVVMVYDSRSDAMGGGEISRYITQLKYEASFIDIQFIQGKFSFSPMPGKTIAVDKSEAVYSLLVKYLTESPNPISPSALSTYLDCSLRFYFRYIEKVYEADGVSEEIDQVMFGRIAHKAIEEIYGSQVGQMVTPDWLDAVMKNEPFIQKCLGKALGEEFFKGGAIEIAGKNLLVYDIIKKYLMRILKYDRSIAPFQLVSLENAYETLISVNVGDRDYSIRIGGIVDRLDEVEGKIRIVDYKTGKAESRISSIEDLFKPGKSNKPAFQTMLYSMVVSRGLDNSSVVVPTVYGARSVFGADFSPHFEIDGGVMSYNVYDNQFTEHLIRLLQNLLNPDVAFEQVSDPLKCRFCPYNSVCNR